MKLMCSMGSQEASEAAEEEEEVMRKRGSEGFLYMDTWLCRSW